MTRFGEIGIQAEITDKQRFKKYLLENSCENAGSRNLVELVGVLAGGPRSDDHSYGQAPDRFVDRETSERGYFEVDTVAFAESEER